MAKFVQWNEAPKSGNSKFLKFTGRNRIRFISHPISYTRQWKDGPKEESVAAVIDCDDENKVKWVSVKRALFAALSSFQEEMGIDPAGAQGPIFVVSKTGSGLQTKYSCMATKAMDIPSNVNTAEVIQELNAFAVNQEEQNEGL